MEGIFRLSGSAVLIQEYKQKFDNGDDVSFENESDPHAVAGLFKLYFRELPAPVMTWEHYDDFIIAECNFPLPFSPPSPSFTKFLFKN